MSSYSSAPLITEVSQIPFDSALLVWVQSFYCTMENLDDLKFEVGQLAETKSFEEGYRGAWFRCKIKNINLKKNQIFAEYYDFPEEEITWTMIYELPDYGRESKQIKKQLMVRPPYPPMYHKSEMPPVNLITEVCVVFNGEWKVGDLVDWRKTDCYWSGKVSKILTDDEVQIQFTLPPTGQGGVNEAFYKDIRPSLHWSLIEGWTLLTMFKLLLIGMKFDMQNGETSCSAQLIFPSQQNGGMDFEREEVEVASPVNASSTSRVSVISLAAPIEEEPLKSQQVKIDGDDVEKASSSDSISTTRVEESKADDVTWENVDSCVIDLNIMHEDTLEASILDLEELANRVKWLKSILDNNQSKPGSWKFS
ncbi:hypothetical protein LXL04_003303 [Taraxacum kok-saghyz]